MYILEVLLLIYFVYAVFYNLLFAIGGFFYTGQKKIVTNRSDNKYLILVPGYKEDAVIVETVKKNSSIDYPSDRFDLEIIADSFKNETLNTLKSLPIKVTEVTFHKSTKVRSLKKALELSDNSYDFVIVLDADNVMESDFLIKVDSFIQEKGALAFQTQRAPKNRNTDMAVLDGISEAINHHLYRMGSSALGFHSSLNGSGMVFDYSIFKNTIFQMDSIGGFDRELEYRLLEQNIKIHYLKEAIVFDEKVDNSKTFENQRKRWISSQYVYLAKYFSKGLAALAKGNVVYFNNTVLRHIQLPRLINLGLLSIITLSAVLFEELFSFPKYFWILLWSVNATVIAISIPRSFYSFRLFKAVLLLPKVFIRMFLIMFKLKGANKKFIHTPHKSPNQ